MKNPQKYKVTTCFGLSFDIGAILDCYVLNIDQDSGIGLIYHKKDRDGCGSLELCRRDDNEYWVSINEYSYSNLGDLDKSFREFLKNYA